jgi:hypothetical protein
LFDVLARQSLVAYVVHLLFLYGSPFTAGIVRFGRVFDMTEAFGIFLGIGVFTLAIAVLWDHYITSRALALALPGYKARLLRVVRRGPAVRAKVADPEALTAPDTKMESSSQL